MKTIKMIMDVPIDVYTRFVTLSLGTPLNEVLDKIRAEIDEQTEIHSDGEFYIKNIDVKRIIDKYRKEQE